MRGGGATPDRTKLGKVNRSVGQFFLSRLKSTHLHKVYIISWDTADEGAKKNGLTWQKQLPKCISFQSLSPRNSQLLKALRDK